MWGLSGFVKTSNISVRRDKQQILGKVPEKDWADGPQAVGLDYVRCKTWSVWVDPLAVFDEYTYRTKVNFLA